MESFTQVKNGHKDFAFFHIEGSAVVPLPGAVFPGNDEEQAAFASDKKAGSREDNFQTRVWSKVSELLLANKKKALFGVVDVYYHTKDGRKANKLVFVSWSMDDELKVKDKMVAASTKTTLMETFNLAGGCSLQCTDSGMLSFDSLLEAVTKSK
jgi:hypothetical protein